MLTPIELYSPSNREYPLILPEMTYPDEMMTRSVLSQGDIRWKNRHVYLSETLSGETVGLRRIDERICDIYFGNLRLAQLDTYTKRLIHLPRQPRKQKQEKQNIDLINKKVLPICPV